MKEETTKFGLKDQFGYFFGDLGGSMINLYIDMYILVFCTYVLGISTAWMAGLFLIAKIWDAINDPLIGSLPDHFHLGKTADKFKPYIRIAMIPLALSALMCFADVSSWSMIAKQVWVAFSYILYGMSYTGTSMPFGAMASVITHDRIERTKLSRARSIGGTLVGLVFLPIVPLLIWNNDQSANANGFFIIACIAAVCCVIFYSIMLKLSTERYHEPLVKKDSTNNYPIKDVVKDTLSNRPMIGIMIASFGNAIASTSLGHMGSYLYREYYHSAKLMALTGPIGIPFVIISFFLVPKLAGKFGKKQAIIGATIYNAIFAAILYFIPIGNPYVYMVLSQLSNFGQTVFMMLIWALVTDCIDYQEYKTKKRADGTVYSIYTFSKKISSSITNSITTALLGVLGYVSGVAAQAEGVGTAIRGMVTLLPVGACIVELIGIGLIYNLNKKKTLVIYEELEKRHAEG